MAGGPLAPYVGLRPYTEEDGAVFFGRETEGRRLVNLLFSSPLTVLYGASGTGKTSLLRTRLVPDLRADDAAVVYYDRWSEDDVYAALLDSVRALTGPPPAPGDELVALVAAAAAGLDQPVVLVLDQFEEALIRRPPGLERLLDAVGRLLMAQRDAFVLLALREEFLGTLGELRRFSIDPYRTTWRLEGMDRDRAAQIIVRPAEVFGGAVEPALVQAILDDFSPSGERAQTDLEGVGGPDLPLPFLQIVCARLWEVARSRGDRRLTLADYQAQGRRAGVMRGYLADVTRDLSPPMQQDMAQVIQYLAPPSGLKISYAAADLAELTELAPERLARLLDVLQRRCVLRVRETGSGLRYELFHDAFIGVLREWAAEHRQRRTAARYRRWIGGLGVVAVTLGLAMGAFINLWQERAEALREVEKASRSIAIEAAKVQANAVKLAEATAEITLQRDRAEDAARDLAIEVGQRQALQRSLIELASRTLRLSLQSSTTADALARLLTEHPHLREAVVRPQLEMRLDLSPAALETQLDRIRRASVEDLPALLRAAVQDVRVKPVGAVVDPPDGDEVLATLAAVRPDLAAPNLRQAFAALERALPGAGDARLWLAAGQLAALLPERAAEEVPALRRATEAAPAEPRYQEALADALVRHGDRRGAHAVEVYREAARLYEGLLATPADLARQSRLHHRLAYALDRAAWHTPDTRAADWTPVVTHYREALSRDDGAVRARLGLIHQQLGVALRNRALRPEADAGADLERSIAELDRAEATLKLVDVPRGQVWRERGETWRRLFLLHEAAGAIAEARRAARAAVTDFTAALELDPTDADALSKRGFVYARTGRAAAAQTDYEKAARWNPADWQAHNRLGWLHATSADPQVRDWRRALTEGAIACGLRYGNSCLDTIAAAWAAKAGEDLTQSARLPRPEGDLLFREGQVAFEVAHALQRLVRDAEPDPAARARYEDRLRLYQANRPYVAPPPQVTW